MSIYEQQLPGVILTILGTGVVLTIPLSFLLLHLYRKSLIKGMGYVSTKYHAAPIAEPEAIRTWPKVEFTITPLETISPKLSPTYNKLKETLGWHWFVFGFACIGFAIIIALTSFLNESLTIKQLTFSLLFYSFPFIPISTMLLAITVREKISIIAIMLFIYMGVCAIFWNTQSNIGFWATFWPILYINLIPLGIVFIVRIKTIRSVGLFVLSFFIVCAAGPSLLLFYLSQSPQVLKYIATPFIEQGYSGHGTFYAIIIIAFLGCIPIAWVVHRMIRIAYDKKWINDIQLNADAIVLIFNLYYASMICSSNPSAAIISLLAFPVYKIICFLLYFLLRRRLRGQKPIRLLLLRVFSLGKESQLMYERITRHWRYGGNIQMISGPDLATSTIEPHEIIDFVSGAMKQHFCESRESIDRNIQHIDDQVDSDSTYRVYEFFCRDNNWKEVLQQLVNSNDCIFMDLRKFGPDFKGCQFEIKSLVNLVPLDKVIFVINKETKLEFMKEVFQKGFEQASTNSPNIHEVKPIQLYKVQQNNSKDIEGLLTIICNKNSSNKIS